MRLIGKTLKDLSNDERSLSHELRESIAEAKAAMERYAQSLAAYERVCGTRFKARRTLSFFRNHIRALDASL